MERDEMVNLEVGERVVFSDGVKGTVISVNNHCVGFVWDDGQTGYIATEDGNMIRKLEVA